MLCDQGRKVAVAHRDNQKQGNVQCGILTPSRPSLVQGDGIFCLDFGDPQQLSRTVLMREADDVRINIRQRGAHIPIRPCVNLYELLPILLP